jgi:putative MATE family efflux protein
MGQKASPIRSRITDWVRPQPAQKSLYRDVLRLALPATMEQLLSMMVGIVDTFLVGHLGAASLAAVGLAAQWVFLAATFFGAIATGSTALIARLIGAQDPKEANQVLRQSVLLGAFVGLGATILGVTLAGPALKLLGAQPDVAAMGTRYLRLVACIFFLNNLMFIGNACLRGAGDTRTPMYVMAVVNALNILVAWSAINGHLGLPKMGVIGSAVGATTAQGVGGILVIAVLLRGRGNLKLRLSGLRPDGDLIRRILRVGLPTGMEQMLFRTGHMLFARVLAELGTVVYAANQVAINGWSLSFMPGFGFAIAATTLVGQSLGAGEPGLAERRGYTTYWIGAGLMTAIGLLFIGFPAQIMGFFTNDPQVIAFGTQPLRMVGLFQPISACMIFSGALRGAGDTRFPMVVTGVGIWLVRVPLAYLFALNLGWGLMGAWGAMALDITVRGVLTVLRFRGGRWKTIKV